MYIYIYIVDSIRHLSLRSRVFLLLARRPSGCHVSEAHHLKPVFLMMSSKEAGGGVLLYLADSRWRWIGESYARHVLFALPVTSQMSPGKTASIPARLFPSDFSNGVGNSRAGVGEQLQGATGREGAVVVALRVCGGGTVQLHCLHDKFYLYFYRQMLLNWKFCSRD